MHLRWALHVGRASGVLGGRTRFGTRPCRPVAVLAGGIASAAVALAAHRPATSAQLLAVGGFVLACMAAVRTADAAWQCLTRQALAVVAAGCLVAPVTAWALAAVAGGAAAQAVDLAVARFRRRGRAGERTLLVGDPADVRTAAQEFETYPAHGVIPVVTATPDGAPPTVLPGGALDELAVLVHHHAVEHVLVVTPALAGAVWNSFGRQRPYGLRVSVVPPIAEMLTAGAEVVNVRAMPVLSLRPRRPTAGLMWFAKRTIDRTAAAVGLLLLLPAIALVALAILIDDGGPVLFRQERVGRNGRVFRLWKFRSMVVDAESMLEALAARNEASGPYFKIKDDPRVTRVGRWLRRLSVDELPQLVNVLRGEMSLVGPRPYLLSEFEREPDLFAWRASFLPGITGLWQIAGRSWLPRAEGLRMDLAYVEHWSLGLDLRILARTALVALAGDRRRPVGDESPVDERRARLRGLVVDDDLVPARPCDLSVVVVTHDSSADIAACLESLAALPDTVTREVIVVDNASRDGTAAIVEQVAPDVRLIRARARGGFSTNCNIGVAASAGRHVLLLNPDTVVERGALDNLVAHLDANPRTGAVGPRLVYPDGRFQPSARRFPTVGAVLVRRTPLRLVLGQSAAARRHLALDLPADEIRPADWLLGAAIAVRRAAIDDVGWFDEGYRLYCEDIDLCWRLQASGWAVTYLPSATVRHDLGELTFKRFLTVRTLWHVRSMARFVRLHGVGTPRPARTTAPAPVPAQVPGIVLHGLITTPIRIPAAAETAEL